jgi:hypothetical protein
MIKIDDRNDMIKISARPVRLGGKVTRNHAASGVDTVLAADHDQIVSSADAHNLREGRVAVTLCA